MVADCSTNAESGAKLEQPLHLHTGRKHLRVGAMNYSRPIAPGNVQYTRDLAPVSDTFEGSTFVETSCLTAEVAVGHSLPAARSSKGFWGQIDPQAMSPDWCPHQRACDGPAPHVLRHIDQV